MIGVRAAHEYVGGTRDSDNVSSTSDMVVRIVVRGMKGVGGVCEMCMCLAWGGVLGEWIRGLGLGFTNPVRTKGMLNMCLCCGGVGDVCGEWLGDLDQGLDGWGGVMPV